MFKLLFLGAILFVAATFLPPLLFFVPLLRFANLPLAGAMMLFLHPIPSRQLLVTVWLLSVNLFTPGIPLPGLLVAAGASISFIRFFQARYMEHTHPLSMALGYSLAVAVYEFISLLIIILGWSFEQGTVFWSGIHYGIVITIAEMVISTMLVAGVCIAEAFVSGITVSTILQRYYEQIHRPRFSSAMALTR